MTRLHALFFFTAVFAALSFCSGVCQASGSAEIWLDISKGEHLLRVMSGGKALETFGVAVGRNAGDKQRVGDMRTPEGSFTVEQVQDASYWTHDFGDGKGQLAPDSIGTDATEGCVRLRNADGEKLKEKYIKIGMRVVIRP